jgi:hypothetical protein
VAVLTGAGGTFCAGADLKGLSEGRGNRVEVDMALDGPMGPTRMDLSKPVVAAINGTAQSIMMMPGFTVTRPGRTMISMPTKPMCCRFTGPHGFGKWMLRCAVNGLNLLKTQFRCVLVLSQVAFVAHVRLNSIETILFLTLGRARIHSCPIRRSSCGQRGERCRLYEFVLQAS